MKRILILLLLLFPLAISSAKTAKAKSSEPESPYTSNKKTLFVSQKNPTLTIKLESTPSTGFIWILKRSDRNLLKLLKHVYIPSEKNMPGAPGTDVWIFSANLSAFSYGEGTELVFIHAQPWNQNEQISVKKFRVARR